MRSHAGKVFWRRLLMAAQERRRPPFGASLVASICLLLAVPHGAFAQPAQQYQPKEYQDGKDVVWVPTATTLVERMLDIANVTANDYVVDLGSGDGRTVIAAAKRGAKALGVEYNPKMVDLSKQNAQKAGVTDRAAFVKADLFKTDFSQATVLTLFLLPEINLKLRPKILAMKPGTRVVSNSFDMGDWKADKLIDPVEKCEDYCNAFFWVVPAKVAGTWQTPEGRLVLKQSFQFFTGALTSGKVVTPLTGGRLNADEVTFTARNAIYKGRVTGNVMDGSITTPEGIRPWQAKRI
jgi:SAM-dependent methyltransferase